MKVRIIEVIGRALLARFTRTERVIGPDPTIVVQYTYRDRRPVEGKPSRVHVIFTACFGLESTVYVFGRQFDAYDNALAYWVFNAMEDAYTEKMDAYEDDPMGHPGRYM